MAAVRHSRKIVLINPEFQLRLVASMLVAALIAVFSGYAIFTWELTRISSAALRASIRPQNELMSIILERRHQGELAFLGLLVVTACIAFYYGLRMSHRCAGVIHRIKRHLTEISQGGAVGDVVLRRSDGFQDLADVVNNFLQYHQNTARTRESPIP